MLAFLKLFVAFVVWRVTGARAAGGSLVRALGAGNDDLRDAAGMLLVKGGKRAAPLLLDAIERRQTLPLVLTMLADLGDPAHAATIRRYVDDRDPDVARSAVQALRVLDLHGE